MLRYTYIVSLVNTKVLIFKGVRLYPLTVSMDLESGINTLIHNAVSWYCFLAD